MKGVRSSCFGVVLILLALFSSASAESVTALRGTTRPAVARAQDLGEVTGSMSLTSLHVYYTPTQGQMTELHRLIVAQQDPNSPDYHRWISPEQFGKRFGISTVDETRVRQWLEAEGVSTVSLDRSRRDFTFTTTAAHAEVIFHTQIHALMVHGEKHFANVSDIALPSSLAGVIGDVRGLDDFKPKAYYTPRAQFSWGPLTNTYDLAPGDIATIYDITSLYNAGITGSGVTAAVVGQADVDLSNVTAYRANFNLPANTPTVVLVPGSADPGGLGTSDEAEGEMDLELLGAVATGANLVYVNSTNAWDSAEYAIQQNLAPVVSMSYGWCEAQDTPANQQLVAIDTQEANAQGMTLIAASGDTGPAECDSTSETSAQDGLALDSPANQPAVTGVGGTSFINPLNGYFGTTNGPTGGSALNYIPESAWNLTASQGHLEASGGGASIYFSKPAWQEGPGVPADSARDVPDVSMFSLDNATDDQIAYIVCVEGGCASGPVNMQTSGGAAGGTSAAAPVFAGIITLVNHYLVKTGVMSTVGLGNINPDLYALAQNAPNAFHDITQGNNIVPCATGTPDCTTGTFGYSAGPGYDQVTGLGSVDAYDLVQNWSGSAVGGTAVTLSTSQNSVVYGTPITLTAKVAATSSGTVPTGAVTFYSYAGVVNTWTVIGTAQLDSTGTATLSLSSGLAEDTSVLQAEYSGSSTLATSLSNTINVYQPTEIVVTPSAYQVTQGASVTLTANVAGATLNAGGTVTFYDNGNTIGSASLSTSSIGVASITTTSLPIGNNTITASYSGSTYFAASTSPGNVVVTVNPALAAATTTSLTSSATQVDAGSALTLTAIVSTSAGTPSGSVTFYSGTTALGAAVSLSNGSASLTVSTLPAGTYTLSAVYGGEANVYAGSTSNTVSVSVLQPSFTLSAAPSSLSVTAGQSATTTLTVTPQNGFSGALTFTCAGLPSGDLCAFGSPVVQSNGTSTVTLTISTAATTASAALSSNGMAPLLAIVPLLGLGSIRRRKALVKTLSGFAALFIVAFCIGMMGCGGGSQAPTSGTGGSGGGSNGGGTSQTYTLIVTAASSSATQTTNITLAVNN